MIAHGYAHTCGWVVEQENGEEKPVPSKKVKVCGNSSEGKNSSDNQKTTRHPLHTIERNIFEHKFIIWMNRKITNSFFNFERLSFDFNEEIF